MGLSHYPEGSCAKALNRPCIRYSMKHMFTKADVTIIDLLPKERACMESLGYGTRCLNSYMTKYY